MDPFSGHNGPHGRNQRGVWDPDPPPPEKSQKCRVLSNTGPDPLKSHKATKPAFNLGTSSKRNLAGFAGGSMMACFVVFGSSLPSPTKKIVRFEPPLTKLSRSAHGPVE